MSIFTSKNIVITPGFNGSLATSFSQIDFKWYDAGIGTFKFLRSPLDIRATIYNWQENGEPSLVFGGLGSFLGSTYFAGPYNDINGTYTGFTTTPTVRILPLSGRIFANQVYSNFILDSFGSSGIVGQFLSRSSNGTLWASLPSGIVTGSGLVSYYALFNGTNSLGVGNITDDGSTITFYATTQFQEFVEFLNSANFNELTTGVLNLTGQLLLNSVFGAEGQVVTSNGSAAIWTSQISSALLTGTISSARISGSYSGITSVGVLSQLQVNGITSANQFFGNGSNLTNLNASNLADGVVPSARISGAYSGITSVGTLSQLRVTGITTSTDTFINGRLYASSNPGLANSVLVSTGTGIAWSTFPSVTLPAGIITGTGIVNALPRFLTPSSIGTSSILDNGVAVTVNSDVFFLGLSQFNGDIEALGGIEAADYLWAKNSFELDGPFFDVDDNPGVSGQVLVSLGTSVRWANASSSGGLTGFGATNFITKFIGTSVVVNSSITDNGITVGVNTNFTVSGISTLSTTFLTGRLFVGGTPGLANSVLVSTGSGVAWTSMQSVSLPVGIITGTGAIVDRLAKFVTPNQIVESNLADDGSTMISLIPFESSSITALDIIQINGFLYDANVSGGSDNQILSSNGSNVVWTSQVPSSFLVGIVTSARISGSYSGITSVGVLSQLQIIGITSAGQFFGNGSNLTNLNASNLTDGTVPSARISGSYSGITSVGTLAQLQVNGITSSLQFFGNGSNLTNLNASNLSDGAVSSARISGSYSGITSVGTLAQLRVTGITTSTQFFGNGSNLTNLNASNLSDGTVPSAAVTGAYAGITSLGSLTQLRITGISTFSDTFLSGRLYASGNPGLANSILVSTGTGIAWSSLQSTSIPVGIITGTGAIVDRLAKFVTPNQIVESNLADDGSTMISLIPFESSSITALDVLQVGGFLYDTNTSGGSPTQILSSTGSNVIWTSQINSSFLTGNIPSVVISGSYSGITSVGTLTQLRVTGITTSAQFFGNGSNLTNLNATNLSDGTVPSARISGSYSGITSIGALTQLQVTGIASAGQFFGNGSNLTNLNATNLSDGTVPSARISGSYSGITSVGTLAQLRVTGITTSTQFFGNGSNLTNLNASNLSDGTVPSARISGSYSGITSIGALTQLRVTGITTVDGVLHALTQIGINTNLPLYNADIRGALRVTGAFYDSLVGSGTTGQVLTSLGTGIVWTTASGTGNISGSVSSPQIPVANGSNILTGFSTFVFNNGRLGVGSATPAYTFDLNGTLRVTNQLIDSSGRPGLANSVLVSTGTGIAWTASKRSLVVSAMTAFTPTSIGIDSAVVIVPHNPDDGLSTLNFALSRVTVRVETPSSGISTINIMKSTATGPFLGTNILASNIILSGISSYEAFTNSFTGLGVTASSGDKLAVNFVGLSTFHTNFTVQITMKEI